jgi:actin-related protein 10
MELGAGIDLEIQPIVLDIGMDYTKMGFSKDPIPRVVLKTPLSISRTIRDKQAFGITTLADIIQDNEKLMLDIEEFLKEVFTLHGMIDTKGHTICICEQLLFPRSFTQSLATVLFTKYQFSSVYFFLSDTLPLYTTGLNSGLIIDCGFIHTSVAAVIHTIFSIEGMSHSYFGSAKLEHKIIEYLKEDNVDHHDLITTELVQQVIPKILKVLSRKQFESFFKSDENITKMKAKLLSLENLGEEYKDLSISYHTVVASMEVFFDQHERSENINLAWMICNSLLNMSLTNRILAIQNLILTGGVFMIPGIKKRLIEEIHYTIDHIPRYQELRSLKEVLKIERSVYPPNIQTWIGASLLSCLNQEIDAFLVTHKEFEDELKGKLPDRFGH